MRKRAAVDTGPLVAIVRDREEAHGRCVAALESFQAPLLTCWPVLTEAAWLLRNDSGGVRALGRLVGTGAVGLVELDRDAFLWMIEFLDRYADVGAQLADAALMYLAEREGIDTAFTLDRRDFAVYRTSTGRSLTIVPEPA